MNGIQNMEYKVNMNDPNVSTTLDKDNNKKPWNINDVYRNEFNIDTLVQTLDVIDTFKRKYPNDDIVEKFETIVRNEICIMFGGSLNV